MADCNTSFIQTILDAIGDKYVYTLTEPQAEQLVIDTYAKYCRYMPFGDGKNSIDEAGFNYWVGQLLQRKIFILDFPFTFEKAMNERGWYQSCRLSTLDEITTIKGLTHEESVIGLFIGTFGRLISTPGYKYWTEDTELVTIDDISKSFVESEEWVAKYATMSNEEYVVEVYKNLFNRTPAPDGLAYWTGELDSGAYTKAKLVSSVIGGAVDTDFQVLKNKIYFNKALIDTELSIDKAKLIELTELLNSITVSTNMIDLILAGRLIIDPTIGGLVKTAYTLITGDAYTLDWGDLDLWIDGERWYFEGTVIPNGKPLSGIVEVREVEETVAKTAYTLITGSDYALDWGSPDNWTDGEEWYFEGTPIPDGQPLSGLVEVREEGAITSNTAYTLITGSDYTLDWGNLDGWIDGERWYFEGTPIPDGQPLSGLVEVREEGATVTHNAETVESYSVYWADIWANGEEWYIEGEVVPDGQPRSGVINKTTTPVTKTAYTLITGSDYVLYWGDAGNWVNGETWYFEGTTTPSGQPLSGIVEVKDTPVSNTAYTLITDSSYTLDWGNPNNWVNGEEWYFSGTVVPNGQPLSGIVEVKDVPVTKTAYTSYTGPNYTLDWGADTWIDGEEWFFEGHVIPNGQPRTGWVQVVNGVVGAKQIDGQYIKHEGQYTSTGIATSGAIVGKTSGARGYYNGTIIKTNGTYIEYEKQVSAKLLSNGGVVANTGQYVQNGIATSGTIKGRTSGATAYYNHAILTTNGTYTTYTKEVGVKTLSSGGVVANTGQYIGGGISTTGTIKGGTSGATASYRNATLVEAGTYEEGTEEVIVASITSSGQYIGGGISTSGTIKSKTSGATATYANGNITPNGTYTTTLEDTKIVGVKTLPDGGVVLETGQYIEGGINISGTIRGEMSGSIATYTNATLVSAGTYTTTSEGVKTVGVKTLADGGVVANTGQYIEGGIGANGTIKGKTSGSIATYTNATLVSAGTYTEGTGAMIKEVGVKTLADGGLVIDRGQYIEGGISTSGTIKGETSGATATYTDATIVENGTYTEE